MVATSNRYRTIIRGAGKRLFEEWEQHNEILLVGAADTGKSVSVALWIDMLCRLHAGLRVLVFRKTRASLTESWIQTFRKALLNPEFYTLADHGEEPDPQVVANCKAYLMARNGYLFDGPGDANRASINYRNGSRIIFGGMNNETRLFSTEYDLAFCNECNELTLGEWESIRRALRNTVLKHHPMIGDCNPDHPNHWLLDRIRSGRMVEFKAFHTDNPWITDTERGRKDLRDMDAQFTGVRRKRLLLGQWAGSDRMIYTSWDDAIHTFDGSLYQDTSGAWWLEISDPKPRKVKLLRFVGGQDWGFTNPGCQQVWGLDEKGRMYLVREHYHTGWNIDKWAEIAVENYKRFNCYPIVCDHDPGNIESFNDRLGPSRDRDAPRIAIEAIKEVQAGIDHIRDRLELDDEGLPRLMIWRKSLAHDPDPALTGSDVLASMVRPSRTAEEFPQYVNREVKDDAEDTKRDDPLKKNDHGVDPARYVGMWSWRVMPTERAPSQTYAEGTYGSMFRSHRRNRAS